MCGSGGQRLLSDHSSHKQTRGTEDGWAVEWNKKKAVLSPDEPKPAHLLFLLSVSDVVFFQSPTHACHGLSAFFFVNKP